MEVNDLLKKYLAEGRMMQIATLSGDQPWICTVYFVEDAQMNLYWLSLPSRRHSQEIAAHSKIAVAIPIKFDKPVVGIQAEGTAEMVQDHTVVAEIMKLYVARYQSGHDFHDNFVAGKSEHMMYKFTPATMFLFDELTFGDGKRRQGQQIG